MPSNTRNEEETNQYDRKRELQEFDDTKAGVKGLLESGVERIPRIFVDEQYVLEQKITSNFSVPMIDLGCLNKGGGREKVVEKVKHACSEWGFFQIVNHGIPESEIEKVLEAVRGFHELDKEIKKQYYSRECCKPVFYNSTFDLYQTQRANWRDSLNFIMAPNPPQPHQLPQVCRETMMEFSKQVNELGIILFELMSEALGLHKNHLKDMDCAEGLFVAGNYYPACPQPNLTLGHTSHTDSGFLTLLLQDQIGGLQVLHQNQWVDVPPSPGALIVNVGDLMQLITNSMFKSVYHRVLANSVGPRISVAFFFRMHLEKTSKSRVYGPIKELLSEDCPPMFREILGEEIVACRVANGFDGTPLLSHFMLNPTE